MNENKIPLNTRTYNVLKTKGIIQYEKEDYMNLNSWIFNVYVFECMNCYGKLHG